MFSKFEHIFRNKAVILNPSGCHSDPALAGEVHAVEDSSLCDLLRAGFVKDLSAGAEGCFSRQGGISMTPTRLFECIFNVRIPYFGLFQKWKLLLPALLGLIVSCTLHAETKPFSLAGQFDAERAFKHVQKQVEFGPRPSGSAELKKTREYLAGELRACGLDVQEQAFTQATPRGPIEFVNLVAGAPRKGASSLWPDRRKILVLASHYDTKWLPKVRFVGANDSASSTAVLLEVARVVAQARFNPSKVRIQFVFFDGEEAIQDYGATDGLYGSRYFVQQARAKKNLSQVQAMVLLDMIGDRDLSIQIAGGNDKLTQQIFEAARTLGFRDSFRLGHGPMMDDHAPFVSEGIPAIDLIDFQFGPGNRWWHTTEDTLEKISPQSLKIVGQTVLEFLQNFQR